MKKILEKIGNMETSKKILTVVTIVWILSVVTNYVLAYLGIESNMVNSTFNLINTTFIVELGYYGAKSGVENVSKINSNTSNVEELINKAVDKIKEIV